MPPHIASIISLGILATVDTYLTATAIPLPVWVTFIAWASFFACGGGQQGLVKSVVSNWTGILIASASLLVIQFGPAYPITAAISVGVGTAAMIAVSAIPILNFPPAIVFGFASLVGTSAATDTTILASGLSHPTLVAMAAMLLGGLFGFASELGTQLLTGKKSATA